ncbi:unnamed protein product, partial [Mesorhabditis belari]|uniref:Phospholipid/glycerol acyltransferase domain-containing protein n=1 Tax=Mesorhabditis belari TaxID=2138241 RepID=A0AAF3J1W7_9BILA
MAEGEPPVVSRAASWKEQLKGWVFAAILYFSALFGVFYVLVPLSPLVFFSPSIFRHLTDRMIGLWLILPSGLLKLGYGSKVNVIGDAVDHSEPALIIMNHRTRLDWLFFWMGLYQQDPWLLTSEKITLKSILKYVPGAGWAMQINSYIFLERSFETDKSKLQRILNYFSQIGMNYQVLLFPEGTDKCPRATERSRVYAEKKGLVHYQYLLHPRVTGFVFMIQEMRKTDYIKYIYDVTVGFDDKIVQSEADFVLHGVVPKQVHFQTRKIPITELPTDDKELGQWLVKLWAEKEEKLKRFYLRESKEKTTFPNTANGQSWPMRNRDNHLQNIIIFVWIVVTSLWGIGYLFLPLQWIYSILCCSLMIGVYYRFGGWEWLAIDIFNQRMARKLKEN